MAKAPKSQSRHGISSIWTGDTGKNAVRFFCAFGIINALSAPDRQTMSIIDTTIRFGVKQNMTAYRYAVNAIGSFTEG